MTLPHHDRKRRTRRTLAHHVRGSTRTRVRVGGGVYVSASQVRAQLDRVDGRWRALAGDYLHNVPAGAQRTAFGHAYDSWRAFYRDAYNDWLAWGSNVDQSEAFDRELDTWRSRYVELTGRQPTSPTTSRTGSPPDSGFGTALKWGLGIGVVALIGYALISD